MKKAYALALFLALACGDDASFSGDGGFDVGVDGALGADLGPEDAGRDASFEDLGPTDTGVADGGVPDTGVAMDSGVPRDGGADVGPDDSGVVSGPCLRDERAEAGRCVPCEVGATNEAGDDPAEGDTRCDPADACSDAFGVSCARFDEGYFKASNTGASDDFGFAVAVSGETLVVGAPFERSASTGVDSDGSDDSAPGAGAAYVFERREGSWAFAAYLKASNAGARDFFGSAVAVSGRTLLVGAPGESSDASGVDGDPSNDRAERAGAVYVFERNDEGWVERAYLKASDSAAFAAFGSALSLEGDTAVVGAPRAEYEGLATSGAAYVFRRGDGAWSEEAVLTSSNLGAGDGFGTSVSLSAGRIAVGAPGEDSDTARIDGDGMNDRASDSGAVYLFERTPEWVERAYLKGSNSNLRDRFGTAVALHGNTLVVGAPSDSRNARGVNPPLGDDELDASGAAYIFVDDAGWAEVAYLKAAASREREFFGSAVAVFGELVAVGAPGNSAAGRGFITPAAFNVPNSGATYVFLRRERWIEYGLLKAPNAEQGDRFGEALAMDGQRLVVAAPDESSSARGVGGDSSDNGALFSGAVYLRRVGP